MLDPGTTELGLALYKPRSMHKPAHERVENFESGAQNANTVA
jgi:hypothetical protein